MDWLLGGFMPRMGCGAWDPMTVGINITANSVIALAYFAIPAALGYLYWKRKRALPRSWMVLCFIAFIVLCGLTHVCDVVAFWAAPYRLFTLVDASCALVSILTAMLLPDSVRHVLTLRTPSEYQEVIKLREKEVRRVRTVKSILRRHNEDLMKECMELRGVLRRLEPRAELGHEVAGLTQSIDRLQGMSTADAVATMEDDSIVHLG